MANNVQKRFKHLSEKIFNTEDGVEWLAILRESYVVPSSLSSDAIQTAYSLGKKELVLELIQYMYDPNLLEEIKIEVKYE